jgi:hypothetical protein
MWFRLSIVILCLWFSVFCANAQRNTDVPIGPVVSPSILGKPTAKPPVDKRPSSKNEKANTKENATEGRTGTTAKPK